MENWTCRVNVSILNHRQKVKNKGQTVTTKKGQMLPPGIYVTKPCANDPNFKSKVSGFFGPSKIDCT